MTPHEIGEPTRLSPDEAFTMLGNETRLQILQTLAEADAPLSFTEVRERVGITQGAQFNYHLDQLVGHFVQKIGDGYKLRQAGRNVIYAVLSNVVTDAPLVERTRIDHPCPYCQAPIEVRYNEGYVEQFCTECAGAFGEDDFAREETERGYLGRLKLPPAGLQDRTAAEIFRVAWVWTRLVVFAVATGFCPHCSASLDRGVGVCDDHDATEGQCETCGRRHPILFHFECTNCMYNGAGTLEIALATQTDLLNFLTARGLNPVSPETIPAVQRVLNDCDEEVRSTAPFEVQIQFTTDGDALTLTVDGDLTVLDVERRPVSETV